MFLAELFPYADVVYNVLIALYALTVLTVIGVVLSENRNPVKSMAWVLVLLLLPVVVGDISHFRPQFERHEPDFPFPLA